MSTLARGAWCVLVGSWLGCASSAPTASGSDAGLDAGADTSPVGVDAGADTSPVAVDAGAFDAAGLGAPRRVSASFRFAEGPCWSPARGDWLFTDIEGDTIYELGADGGVGPYRTPSHHANGLALDRGGLLLAAEHETRAVTRANADGTTVTLASAWQGKRLNSPNDLVVRSDGSIYFTDPTYGLGSAPSELGYTGLYRIDPLGALHLEAKVDGQPNGLDFVPGEGALLVAATTANVIWSFPVAADGSLGAPRTFASVTAPDGLAVDEAGDVYVAALEGGAGALVVLSPEGSRLTAVPLAEQPTNCGFGGLDGRTLLVTARTAVYELSTPIAGRR